MLPIFKTFTPHPEIAVSQDVFDPAIHKAVYRFNYPEIFSYISANPDKARGILRSICKQDRFFIVLFVMGIEKANHPFIVKMCRMCEDGPDSGTVDIWAREHFKSTIITIAGTVQRIINNPECTTAIFSFKKPAAEKFLDAIRKVLEVPFMYWLFPDILYEKPETQAPSWSLQGGIRVNRLSTSRKEHTVETFGLVEGMPTGGHFDHRVYDDVETDDLATNPDQLDLCFRKFEMSRNLGSDGGTEQIIGTYYSHNGVLVKMGNKKDIHGQNMYTLRIIPATEDGSITGAPVFFSQKYLDSKKTDSTFNTQQLCNPSPVHDIKLHFDRFQTVTRKQLPKDRLKFMIIDPAGDKEVQTSAKNDSWAMLLVSVQPVMDDLGISNVFIEDGLIAEMSLSSAIDAACRMYSRHGRIDVLGIEKVANDTTYKHIHNALTAAGRYLQIRTSSNRYGNLWLLSPSGRTKNYRIETNLAWPLNNSKLHFVDDLSDDFIARIKEECNKFPFFHVDGLDGLAYTYDILADPVAKFNFHTEDEEEDEEGLSPDKQNSNRSIVGGY